MNIHKTLSLQTDINIDFRYQILHYVPLDNLNFVKTEITVRINFLKERIILWKLFALYIKLFIYECRQQLEQVSVFKAKLYTIIFKFNANLETTRLPVALVLPT